MTKKVIALKKEPGLYDKKVIALIFNTQKEFK